MNTELHPQGKSFQLADSFYRRLFNHSTKFVFLFLLTALFTGHERSNPKVGESLVDFFLEQTRAEVKTQATILLLNTDSSGFIESYVNKLTNEFYELREYSPAWTYNYTTTDFYTTLTNFIDSLDFYGIPNEFMNSENIRKLYAKMSKYKDDEALTHRIALEIHTTRQFFKTMLYLNRGIFSFDTSKAIKNLVAELPATASKAFGNNTLSNFIHQNQPDILPYQHLIHSLPDFIDSKRLASKIGLDTFKVNDTILAKCFYYIGYLAEPVFDSVYTIEKTIAKLQKAHGLEQSGNLTPETLTELANLLEKRFHTICLNIDRLRKLEHEDKDYLFVNIPSYKLAVVKNKQKMLDFNVVVGKKKTPTPVLSSKIEKVVANPYWTVPRSITKNEMLRKIRADSNFLSRNGYMIIDNYEEEVHESMIDWNETDPLGNKYWIRQQYGRGNALGQVKFLFPNNRRVYLHDTPSKRLFKKEYRAYSHGCVRLENPDKLAQFIFDNFVEQEKKLNFKTLVRLRKRQVVDLPVQIPIHIQYLTCMGNEKGELEFYDDVYHMDETSLKDLFNSGKERI